MQSPSKGKQRTQSPDEGRTLATVAAPITGLLWGANRYCQDSDNLWIAFESFFVMLMTSLFVRMMAAAFNAPTPAPLNKQKQENNFSYLWATLRVVLGTFLAQTFVMQASRHQGLIESPHDELSAKKYHMYFSLILLIIFTFVIDCEHRYQRRQVTRASTDVEAEPVVSIAFSPDLSSVETALASIPKMDKERLQKASHKIFSLCRGNTENMQSAIFAYHNADCLDVFAKCILMRAHWNRTYFSDESIVALLDCLYLKIGPKFKADLFPQEADWDAFNFLLNHVEPTHALTERVMSTWSQKIFKALHSAHSTMGLSAFHWDWQVKMLTKLVVLHPESRGHQEALNELVPKATVPAAEAPAPAPAAPAAQVKSPPKPRTPPSGKSLAAVYVRPIGRASFDWRHPSPEPPPEPPREAAAGPPTAALSVAKSDEYQFRHLKLHTAGPLVFYSPPTDPRPVCVKKSVGHPPDLSMVSDNFVFLQQALLTIHPARLCLVGGRANIFLTNPDDRDAWAAPEHGDVDLALFGQGDGTLVEHVKQILLCYVARGDLPYYEEHPGAPILIGDKVMTVTTFSIQIRATPPLDLCVYESKILTIETQIEASMRSRVVMPKEVHVDMSGQETPHIHYLQGTVGSPRATQFTEHKTSRLPKEWAYALFQYHSDPTRCSALFIKHLAECPVDMRGALERPYNILQKHTDRARYDAVASWRFVDEVAEAKPSPDSSR